VRVLEAAMWGFVGGLALVIGALIAFALRPSKHAVAYVMAFGAGVLISAVAYDLTADAFELGGCDAVAIGLAAGALVYAGLSLLTRPRGGGDRTEAGARALALGALLDGIPESAAIGLTLVEGGEVSGAFLAAVFISNLPEGISSSQKFEVAGRRTAPILLIWLGIAAASALAAGLGYELLGGGSEDLQAATKAFAGGAILTMLATEMMPDAFEESGKSLLVGLITVLGFALAAGLTAIGG
jgi:zinc transporter, ZIP family